MKTDCPDAVVDIKADYCIKCGESLGDCERVLDYTLQVISQLEMKPVIKELRHYKHHFLFDN